MARHLLQYPLIPNVNEEKLLFTLLRRAGLLTQREARKLERSTIALRVTTAFYAGLALTGLILVGLLAGFGVGTYYSSHFGSEPPPPQRAAESASLTDPSSTPDIHDAYQARMDRLLKELGEVSDRQKALEARLTNKSTEAAELASQSQLLRAQLRIKEREIQTLSVKPEPEPGRKFVQGPTRYLHAVAQAEAPRGFFSGDEPQVKAAMAASEAPAEILIDINPPDARPGNPYRLRLEIHNRGNTSINVTDLELVWNYAGRNTGGPIPFSRRLVGPRSTSVLYEVEGVWIEELAAGAILATVTLEGGHQLVNNIRWNEG